MTLMLIIGYNVPVHTWARHTFDEYVKSDHITNNMCESFNNWIGLHRHKPILTLLEGIRCKLMVRFQKRYHKGCAWEGLVTKNIKIQLKKVVQDSMKCLVLFAGNLEFDISHEGTRYPVNLATEMCSCR